MTDIRWFEKAWNDYCDLQLRDRRLLKKINELIKDTQRNPYNGLGKPEKLVSLNQWSRRIDEKNRLIYSIEKDCIIINSCTKHYHDK